MEQDYRQLVYTLLQSRYKGMIDRCYNIKAPNYNRYGGRGLRVCRKWKRGFIFFYVDSVSPFMQYLEDISEVPEIDRIDNDGGYYPENCRWIDRDGNMLNSRAWGDDPIDDRHKDLTYKFNDFDHRDVLKRITL